jgi:hypothetical protein
MAYDTDYFEIVAAGSKGNKGDKGDDGTSADEGAWELDTYYSANSRVRHAKTGYGDSVYRCKTGQGHTSEAANEPEVGASWSDKWEIFAEGGQDGAGTGDVVGPSSSVTDDAVGFADTSGKLLKSLGSLATRISASLTALAAYTTAPVGASDYLIMSVGGVWKRILADDYSKRKVPVPIVAQAWRPLATGGCADPTPSELATHKFYLTSLGFGYSTKTYACFKFKLPKGYDGGTIDAIIEWHSTGTTTNGVRWGVQGASIGDNEPLDVAMGAGSEITDNATGAANRNLVTGTITGITLGGVSPAAGETIEIEVYRDPTHADDNLNEIVLLDDVTLLIGINKHSEA